MAYSTQTHFLKILFPNEMSIPLPDNSGYNIKSYESCCDTRSWSLNKAERAQYFLELFSAKELPIVKPAEDTSTDQTAILKAQLEEKQREIDELKKMIKELQDKIALLACQLESSQCCRSELDCLKKQYEENISEIESLQCELKEEKDQLAYLTKENKTLKDSFNESCTRANKDYDELLQKYNEAECQLQAEQSRAQCQQGICEQNNELQQNLKELCKKINWLNAKIKALEKKNHQSDKAACQAEQLQEEVTQLKCELEQIKQENCELQNQVTNNVHFGIAEAQICQLTKENEELRQQLQAYCDNNNNSPCEQDSGNESDQALQEAYDQVVAERDCLQNKFKELQPELEELESVVQDYAELECNYDQLLTELSCYKERQCSLVERLKMLLDMESEFRQLQKRVCESERLLTEYQVLQKLECLRAGYNENENQVDYSQQDSPTACSEECSESYESGDSATCDPEQIPNLEITYMPTKKRCQQKKRTC